MAGDDEGLGVEGVQVASRGSVLTRARALNKNRAVPDRQCATSIVIRELCRKDIYYIVDLPVQTSSLLFDRQGSRVDCDYCGNRGTGTQADVCRICRDAHSVICGSTQLEKLVNRDNAVSTSARADCQVLVPGSQALSPGLRFWISSGSGWIN